ncbi:hypothetical protein BpHYR1_048219 [Brachionus plicatilis]|uniref:Uncharacterized protein n=1 Tax=Brachionus plicatilis TaxID=10195 RepID=A0A3M7RYE5_BRAPC|nr:hypothetical protein BpHYR1_048219 [Brachionus plicatilis]
MLQIQTALLKSEKNCKNRAKTLKSNRQKFYYRFLPINPNKNEIINCLRQRRSLKQINESTNI